MSSFEDKIRNKIKEICNEEEVIYIYGVIPFTFTKPTDYLLGPVAAFKNKFCYLIVEDESMHILGLDLKNEFDTHLIINIKDITNIKFKGWNLGFGKQIEIELYTEEKIKFQFMKKPVGLKNQEDNIKKLELKFNEFFKR